MFSAEVLSMRPNLIDLPNQSFTMEGLMPNQKQILSHLEAKK